ncbi:MAG: hypothetical protein ACLQLH_00470 [Terracidiphilus sp.]
MAKRANKKKQVQEESVSTQIQWDVKADTPSYYVNVMGVSHTPYDFTLSVAKIPSPLMQEQAELVKSGQQLPIEPMMQLVMPPLLIDGLINALIDQQAKYQKTVAQQVKNNELQHQHLKSSGTVN